MEIIATPPEIDGQLTELIPDIALPPLLLWPTRRRTDGLTGEEAKDTVFINSVPPSLGSIELFAQHTASNRLENN